MRKLPFFLLFGVFLVFAFAQQPKPPVFGTIDFIEGSVSVTRANKVIANVNPGDIIMIDDFVKTGNDGSVIIQLDKKTGMRGTVTLKPKTTVYLRLKMDANAPKTIVEVMAGQIQSKLAKLSGNPSFSIATDTAVMGVRGTEFGVVASPTGGTLVYCSEGSVECSEDQGSVIVNKGQSVEKKFGERFSKVPVAVSNYEAFVAKWWADDIEAFRANPARALKFYKDKYDELSKRFNTAFETLQKSKILTKWLKEDTEHVVINPNNPETMREKKEIIGPILEIRKILVIFERIYYRMLLLEEYIKSTNAEKTIIVPGMTAGDFIRKISSEASAFEKKVALFRFAEILYNIRNGGPGMFDDDDNFFGSSMDD